MHGNSNFERTTRKERNDRPPRGNTQEPKRGKTWSRDNKRDQWNPIPVTDMFR
jgi:hypothetical protein